ncbi:SNARE Pep12 [Schizosaccharomyces octosporus yFS286]|uniref:SNARE Pep12 n=1 Tax=Schizosaccharomyces octosporus (strain yFS286) TaxID=483514 RepID=S9Q4W9_SCHOY|nr:SNARE Pep12 [Schizosaccharomyces octosporus yFS286]EPX75082.1 SNARE Pep12 [Schizosaccharomyces octosporus yFS286]
MSFADLEQGRNFSDQNGEFASLANSIAQKIHILRGNTAAIHRYLVNNITKNLHELLEKSRELSQNVRSDLIRLSNTRDSRFGEEASSFAISKLMKDFNNVLAELQRVQQKCAQQETDTVAAAQATLNQDASQQALEEEEHARSTQQLHTQRRLSNSQLEYQQRLINERQGEIDNITQGIGELNEIFRDLSTIVNEQGELVTNIEYNIGNTATNTKNASKQLQIANERSRKARKRSLCFLIILVVILGIILTALIVG